MRRVCTEAASLKASAPEGAYSIALTFPLWPRLCSRQVKVIAVPSNDIYKQHLKGC